MVHLHGNLPAHRQGLPPISVFVTQDKRSKDLKLPLSPKSASPVRDDTSDLGVRIIRSSLYFPDGHHYGILIRVIRFIP